MFRYQSFQLRVFISWLFFHDAWTKKCNSFGVCYESAVKSVCLSPHDLGNLTVPDAYRVQAKPSEKIINIAYDGWNSHMLSAQIAAILLKETMGYNPVMTTGLPYANVFESISNHLVDTNLEVWADQLGEQYSKYVLRDGTVLDAGFTGYTGRYGFYLPSYMLKNHSLEFWKNWMLEREYIESFCTSNDTDEYLLNNIIRRFTPPWCSPWNPSGENNTCVDIKQSHISYEKGVVEQMIINLKMPMTVSWWPHDNMLQYVKSKLEKKESVIFKTWVPTTIVSQNDLHRIIFPQYTSYCYRNNTHSLEGRGSINCDFPTEKLLKIISASFAQKPINMNAYTFLKMFSISRKDINALLEDFTENNSTALEMKACEWVKTNKVIWRNWVMNNYQPIIEIIEDKHYLPEWTVSVANGFTSSSVIFGMIAMMWTLFNINESVVRAAQPFFLCLIILGSWISSITIILSSLDDRTLSNEQLDTVCWVMPWPYCIGFIFTYVPLTVKIEKAMTILNNAKESIIVKIPWTGAFSKILLALVIESTLLLLWQWSSPLHWRRTCEVKIKEDSCLSSKGNCYSENAWLFTTPIIIFHLMGQIYACIICYKARKFPSAYRETKWIITTIISNTQIFMFAIPILLIVNDQPIAFFLVKSLSVFLNETSVILLMFIPKFYVYYFASEEKKKKANPYAMYVLASGTIHETKINVTHRPEDAPQTKIYEKCRPEKASQTKIMVKRRPSQ